MVILLALLFIVGSVLAKDQTAPQAFPYNYQNVSNYIIKTVMQKADMSTLEYICDTFGPRYR